MQAPTRLTRIRTKTRSKTAGEFETEHRTELPGADLLRKDTYIHVSYGSESSALPERP
jgi:hypothetical protein